LIGSCGKGIIVGMEPGPPLEPLRFVSAHETEVEELPWGPHEWLCRPGLTAAEQLLLVRVRMPAGKAHAFHRHPAMEEIIYVISGTAEQWVDRESRLLRAGDVAHIPTNVIHGTYNAGSDTLVFLAILSPAKVDGPALIDVSGNEPWRSLRRPATTSSDTPTA
jgi:quercetin dioxygenase-like cupin family protein